MLTRTLKPEITTKKAKIYQHKLLRALDQRNSHKGFTLIELIVVILVLSGLAAIALPSLIGQTGKAREAEFKNAVGTINRAQQTFHLETGVFAQGANDTESLNSLNVSLSDRYIDSYNIVANSDGSATLAPTNMEATEDGTRGYSSGIFFNSGFYGIVICQSSNVTEDIAPPTSSTDCGSNKIVSN